MRRREPCHDLGSECSRQTEQQIVLKLGLCLACLQKQEEGQCGGNGEHSRLWSLGELGEEGRVEFFGTLRARILS